MHCNRSLVVHCHVHILVSRWENSTTSSLLSNIIRVPIQESQQAACSSVTIGFMRFRRDLSAFGSPSSVLSSESESELSWWGLGVVSDEALPSYTVAYPAKLHRAQCRSGRCQVRYPHRQS